MPSALRRAATRRIASAIVLAALIATVVAPISEARGASAKIHPTGQFHPALSHRTIGSLRAAAAKSSGHRPDTSLPFLSVGRDRRTTVIRPGTGAPTARLQPAPAAPTTRTLAIAGSPVAVTQFHGLGELESGSLYPADPWVAVNASDTLQVVNEEMRVSSRTGANLLTVETPAVFALPPGWVVSDVRIVWDGVHGRWIGAGVIFPDDGSFSDNLLGIVLSDSSDPTGGWRVFYLDYGAFLPDYPSISSSGDKIALTADVFDPSNSFSFQADDFEIITWSSMLAGGAVTLNGCSFVDLIHGRAAQGLSTGNDVHVIAEDASGTGTTGNAVYLRITSVGACANFVDITDLSAGLGVDAFGGLGPIPSVRQPGGTLGAAIDERPTDAVWQSGNLYWVATQPVSYDAGATWNDEAAVYRVVTHAAGTAPTAGTTWRINPGDTVDAYMAGIGVSRNGTAFVTYSQSSSSDAISWWANRLFTGGTLGTPLQLAVSDAAFPFPRWGDFAGVAMDPTGAGSVWATHMLVDESGNWKTEVARLLVDSDTPSTPGAPTAIPVVGQTLAIPRFKLSWAGSTDAGSGAVSYQVEESIDGGSFARIAIVATTSTTRALGTGHTYRYRILARDLVGNVSGYATGPTITPSIAQSPTSKTGTWGNSSSASYSGGSSWWASAAGATASYTTTGLRSISIVATRATARGSFKVYIDGVYKATVSTTATTTLYRSVVYEFHWTTPGTHTIKIVIVGTSGHPRVDLDAFLIVK
jgi:hypothetical protein